MFTSELISVISKSIILTYFFLTKFANLDIDKPGSDYVGLIQDAGQNSKMQKSTLSLKNKSFFAGLSGYATHPKISLNA